MIWANLLHFYQPYKQKKDIVDAITAQCYRPVAEGLLAHPEGKITINFTGVLLDLLSEYGYQDVIDMYAEAAKRGQVEFVSSAKFHVILPMMEEREVRRQFEINDATGRKYFGDLFKPRGVFLPEMAYKPELAPILESLGYEWIMLDELAYNGKTGTVDYTKLYEIEGTKLKAFFREHRLSATIMSAGHRDAERLKESVGEDLDGPRMIVTGMDGETFGHHRVGHERLLIDMFRDPQIPMVRMSDLLEEYKDAEVETVKTVACTWASSEDDIEKGIQFISWDDPTNPIHKLQWQLMRMAVDEIAKVDPKTPGFDKPRELLDPALGSDQFFWSCAKPWWMIEYIESGAFWLVSVIRDLPGIHGHEVKAAEQLYQDIMWLSWEWQRSGHIDRVLPSGQDNKVRIPLREQTLDAGDGKGKAVWEAYMKVIKREELEAAGRGDYEAAILWRDAKYKLEHKLDVYDLWYVSDLLTAPKAEVEELIGDYKEAYDHIRGGQVEQRSN